MPAPPSWWRSISCRKSTSSWGPLAARRLLRSAVLAIPGIVATPAPGVIGVPWPSCIAVGSVIHLMCAADRQRAGPPQLEPALHAADLRGLGGLDVGGELLEGRVRGVIPLPGGHLHRLLVVHGHVLGEPDVHRVGGRYRGAVEPGSPSSRPPAAPSSSRPSARPAATKIRTQRGRAAPGRRRTVAGGDEPDSGLQTRIGRHHCPSGVTPVPGEVSGTEPGVPGAGAGANGGGLAWEKLGGPSSLQLAPGSG